MPSHVGKMRIRAWLRLSRPERVQQGPNGHKDYSDVQIRALRERLRK